MPDNSTHSSESSFTVIYVGQTAVTI